MQILIIKNKAIRLLGVVVYLLPVLLFVILDMTDLCGQNTIDSTRIVVKIDSIKQRLKQELKPRERIANHLKLVSLYSYSHKDVDSLIDSALRIAESNNFKFYIARALKTRARYNLYLNGNKKQIIADIEQIRSISKDFKNVFLPMWVNSLYAQYYIDTRDFEKAKKYLDIYEKLIAGTAKEEDGTFYTFKGLYFQKTKQYSKAMTEYKIALSKKNPGRIFIYNNIAKLQLEMLNADSALDYVNKSIRISQLIKSSIAIIESYIIKGDAYLLKKDTQNAIQYYEKVEQLRKIPYITKNYTALDKLISLKNDSDRAEIERRLADISMYKRTESYPMLLVQKGKLLFSQGQNRNAEKFCKEGLESAVKFFRFDFASSACDCLIAIKEAQKDYLSKAFYLEKKIEFQTKLNDEKQLITIARNLAQFEFENEANKVKLKFEQNKKILEERITSIKIVAFLFSIFLGWMIYFTYQLKKRNKRIKSQNRIISKALNEKDLLVREIHHRVNNNLQLVSSLLTLQARSLDDEYANQVINASKSRVRSMALIHQGLYYQSNLNEINVKEYLGKLCKELFFTYNVSRQKVNLILNIDCIDIPIETLVPLGLIVNELVTNSLKYGFPGNRSGHLTITLKCNSNDIILIIEDDGIGYDQSTERSDSFGSTLVKTLAEQIEADITIDSNQGTKTQLIFRLDS